MRCPPREANLLADASGALAPPQPCPEGWAHAFSLKANRRCPSRRQHPAKSAQVGQPCVARQSTWGQREDQDKTLASLMADEFYDETADEKLDKKKVAEARREEM